jgi:formylglycine-generating enzyme required for sulfatase activity
VSVGDIEYLLNQAVTPKRIAELINERGVNFSATAAIRGRLQKAGADSVVLQAMEKAAAEFSKKRAAQIAKPPPASPPPTPPPRSDDGTEMVSVPAGEFWMGSDDGEPDEKPRRRVYLDAFHIDKYEVSNALYRRFIEATGRGVPIYGNDSKLNEPNQPVVGVDWNDANAYCSWAGKRLPMEAEWEKAARGTRRSEVSVGESVGQQSGEL